MGMNRRTWLKASALGPVALVAASRAGALADPIPVVDTHQHLWDLRRQRLNWLEGAPEVLKRSYTPDDYAEATRGLGFAKAVYMEVDVDRVQIDAEAESVVGLCRKGTGPTVAAVIGGRPASPEFGAFVKKFAAIPEVKGVRQVLHARETPPGYCLTPEFVKGVRALGEAGLRFDVCLRPAELADGVALAERCPDTRLVIDHCGNADPKVLLGKVPAGEKPSHDADAWKRAIAKLAERPNVICKISGVVAKAPQGWQPDDLAPAVNHCLDSFGPDRVVFGGDWPVCLLGGPLRRWVEALRAIVSERPVEHQRKLWHDNATRFYAIG